MAKHADMGWLHPLAKMLVGALLFGLLKSTQYLSQPFVWRHWPVDEVLHGWVFVARDSVVVAVAVGFGLFAGMRGPRWQPLRLGLCLVTGAAAGQLALMAIGSPDAADGTATLVGRTLSWSLAAACVAGIHRLWRRSMQADAALREAELRRLQIEQQALGAKVQALRRQLEPHFLFNTLATVRHLHATEPAEGRRLLTHLVDYLRLALLGRQRGSLADELALVRAYLGVVSVSLGPRLSLHWDVPAELCRCECPPLVLATLVENAIKHGIAPSPAGGGLTISARQVGGRLELCVSDTGLGFQGSGGSGMGLIGVRALLAAQYGAAAGLSLAANRPHGVCARISLPLAQGVAA